MNLHDFTIHKNMISIISWSFSMPILASNFDECWHQFWLHFGTPLAPNSMFLLTSILVPISSSVFDWKWFQNGSTSIPKIIKNRIFLATFFGHSFFIVFCLPFDSFCDFGGSMLVASSTFSDPFWICLFIKFFLFRQEHNFLLIYIYI